MLTFWSIFTELEELNSEEWIVFRGKSVSKFESFLQVWEEKLEKVEVTPLTARLFSDLHKYKVIMHYPIAYIFNHALKLLIALGFYFSY